MNAMKKFLVCSALLLGALTGVRAAAVPANSLVGNAPVPSLTYGQQSDASAGPAYAQRFTAPENAFVESITWWGFHGANSGGDAFDNFVVSLGDVVQAGVLTSSNIPKTDYVQYTLKLSVALFLKDFTSLSILNDSSDVEWFWQSASAVGNPGAAHVSDVAFSLNGFIRQQNVPEPASLGLMVLALAVGLGAATRRAGYRGLGQR